MLTAEQFSNTAKKLMDKFIPKAMSKVISTNSASTTMEMPTTNDIDDSKTTLATTTSLPAISEIASANEEPLAEMLSTAMSDGVRRVRPLNHRTTKSQSMKLVPRFVDPFNNTRRTSRQLSLMKKPTNKDLYFDHINHSIIPEIPHAARMMIRSASSKAWSKRNAITRNRSQTISGPGQFEEFQMRRKQLSTRNTLEKISEEKMSSTSESLQVAVGFGPSCKETGLLLLKGDFCNQNYSDFLHFF